MSTIILIVYVLAWLIAFIVGLARKRQLDAGNVIVGSYLLYAVFALKLYNMPQPYYDFLPMKWFPFLYLFAMLLIATRPVRRFDTSQITEIVSPNMTILNITAWIFIGCSILSLPYICHTFTSNGVMQLLSDSDAGRDLYANSLTEAEDAGSGISHLPAIIINALSDIAILLLFYYLTLPQKNKIIITGLALSVLIHMATPIMSGQRGSVINVLLTIVIAYFLLHNYVSANIRKWIDMAGIVIICLIAIPILSITVSRFDTEDGGAKGSIIYYVGQAPLNFNNYGLDAGGTRHGDRTFNLAKRLLDPTTPKNFVERRDKYYRLKMDDNIFYTFVGDFTLDFGPYVAVIIFIVFTALITHLTKPADNKIEFHQLLLIYLVACICMQGGFLLYSYSDTAGIKLVVLFCLYTACCLTKKPKEA